MILDTGAFLAEGVRPIEPSRLAFALRTLARVLEIARPALERAPMPWRLVAGVAVDAVIDIANAYADRLDATGINPDVHGWRTDEPPPRSLALVTVCSPANQSHREVDIKSYIGSGTWTGGAYSDCTVIAWQPLPPPYRGE